MADLYEHQKNSIELLRGALRNGYRRPMLALPTGAGKTVIASAIVKSAVGNGKRVAFCVPSLGLVDQTFDRFRANGIDPLHMGIMQASHPWRRVNAPVQICTAQTLSRRTLPESDIVIVDEAHVRHGVYDRWMKSHEAERIIFIGLSATPWAIGLGRQYDTLVKPTSLSKLIDLGFLSKFRVFAPSRPDLSGVRTVRGDYHEGDLDERMNKPELVADIVTTWLARGDNRPTLCFCTSRKHAKAVHDQFGSVGIAAEYIDADTPREEREAIGRALAAGEIKVVCNIGTLTTGIDWDVRCIILARPTKSESLFVQIIGRGLRTADGKADCLILDHSDTHQRLGMVTDIDHDTLCTGREAKDDAKTAEKKPKLPRCCPQCTALMPVLAKACLACGHELPLMPGVKMVDGELVEIGSVERPKGAADSVAERLRQLGKAEVFAQLNAICMSRGRKQGWARHKYNALFGNYPTFSNSSFSEPCPELLSWVKSQDIAWARSQHNKRANHAAVQ